MANTRAPLRQSDLTRYIKAAIAAGFRNPRFTVGRDGTTVIEEGRADDTGSNPCDELLR